MLKLLLLLLQLLRMRPLLRLVVHLNAREGDGQHVPDVADEVNLDAVEFRTADLHLVHLRAVLLGQHDGRDLGAFGAAHCGHMASQGQFAAHGQVRPDWSVQRQR